MIWNLFFSFSINNNIFLSFLLPSECRLTFVCISFKLFIRRKEWNVSRESDYRIYNPRIASFIYNICIPTIIHVVVYFATTKKRT